ncbi:MAG: type I DNA topoisomerase, partial [Campylobacter sp.]|nr:type I DNA topoisomerase [Campylobacter sp.]
LQQSASNRLGFSPKKTMMLAQSLYEGVQTNNGFMGAITYMRTDSLNIAKEALKTAREIIKSEFGADYLPKSANIYTTKSKGAQEAHEAIRPTNLSFTPQIAAQYLEKDMLKLYTLIYNRFLASQMSPSISQTQNIMIKSDKFQINEIESKERKTNAQPPFMTSTLQQSASNRLGFSPKKTMMLAQSLYEGVQTNNGFMGAITYMRTDSLNIAKEALKTAREIIKSEFGADYLPKSANIYTTKSKGAQEAHEAIRPTNLSFTPQIAAQYLEKDMLKLYTLIYNRFLASQMSPSISQTQNIMIKSDNATFKLSGRKVIFDGFYRVYGDMDKDRILPPLNIGDMMSVESMKISNHITEPPSRYSEAGLVKKLESLGIGRPSTYAPTISLLTSRDYVKVEKKQLIPNEIAFTMISVLEEHFRDIVDSEFTSKLEETLDDIAENNADWQAVLSEFYYPFIAKIDAGKKNIKSQKVAQPIGENCPECGGELVKRKGKFGEFIACLNFPKCKYSRNTSSETKFEKKEPSKIG